MTLAVTDWLWLSIINSKNDLLTYYISITQSETKISNVRRRGFICGWLYRIYLTWQIIKYQIHLKCYFVNLLRHYSSCDLLDINMDWVYSGELVCGFQMSCMYTYTCMAIDWPIILKISILNDEVLYSIIFAYKRKRNP